MDIKSRAFFQKLIVLPFVEIIILYGSRAKKTALERSDIDIAIVCPEASDKDWLQVITIIEQADTLLKIDYVRFDVLSNQSSLKQAIKNEGIILYERH